MQNYNKTISSLFHQALNYFLFGGLLVVLNTCSILGDEGIGQPKDESCAFNIKTFTGTEVKAVNNTLLCQMAILDNGDVFFTNTDFQLFRIRRGIVEKVYNNVAYAIAAKGNTLYLIESTGLVVWNDSKNKTDLLAERFRGFDLVIAQNGDVWGYTRAALYQYSAKNKVAYLHEFDCSVVGDFESTTINRYENLAISNDNKKIYISGRTKVMEWTITDEVYSLKKPKNYRLFSAPSPGNSSEVIISPKTGQIYLCDWGRFWEFDPVSGKTTWVESASDLFPDSKGNIWLNGSADAYKGYYSPLPFSGGTQTKFNFSETCGTLNKKGYYPRSYFHPNGKEIWAMLSTARGDDIAITQFKFK